MKLKLYKAMEDVPYREGPHERESSDHSVKKGDILEATEEIPGWLKVEDEGWLPLRHNDDGHLLWAQVKK